MALTSEPITFKLVVGTGGEVAVQAGTAIGGAELVGEGSNVDAAMRSLIGAVLRGAHRRRHVDEEVHSPTGSFLMFARTFLIDAPAKRAGGGELTDEEAGPNHAAILKILDEAESEIRRKLQAISPTYPTFQLRTR
jgi:hypothetical protein